MNKTLIKICGVTQLEDFKFLSDCENVNYIGLIFSVDSPRMLSIENANILLKHKNANKKIVGVFMNQSKSYIDNIISNVDIDILQFHGNESLNFCLSFKHQFIKAIHVKDNKLSFDSNFNNHVTSYLLDTVIKNKQGGTGIAFDWDSVLSDRMITNQIENQQCIIAGGLNPDNVTYLISRYRPYGVDASSGLESGIGKKDHILVKKFIENVRISEKGNNEKN